MGAVLKLSNFFRAAILQRTDEECAKLRSLRVLYAHVSYVPAWLRAFTSNVPFFFYVLFVTSFFICLTSLPFSRALCTFIFLFLHFLRAFIFYGPSFFYVPYMPSFLRALRALRVFSFYVPSVFMYLHFFKCFQLSKDVPYVPSPFFIKCGTIQNQVIIFCAYKKYFQYIFF